MNKKYRIYEYKGKYLVKEKKWYGWSEWEYSYDSVEDAEQGIRLRTVLLVKETDTKAILNKPPKFVMSVKGSDLVKVINRSEAARRY